MSRIGKMPVEIPASVKVELSGGLIIVNGPSGQLKQVLHKDINVEVKDNAITVTPANETTDARAKHGLYRNLINNMVKGVTEGFKKELEIIGVGYKANVSDGYLILSLGFSHDIFIEIPKGITVAVNKTIIVISGIDKQQVGAFAAFIRSLRKPEPYKGKGVRYTGETVRRKAGKKK